MSTTLPAFSVGQKIVYPSQGVGEIREITEKQFRDSVMMYYVIYLPVSDMVVMLPVDKAEEIGIRPIVSKEQAEHALTLIGEHFEPLPSDWKLRYQMNLDLLKKGTIEDIATIVRSLYQRSKIKELPLQERKLYDSARKLLEDEISFSLEISHEEVESLIHEKFEEPETRDAPDFSRDDDDDDDIDMSGEESLEDSDEDSDDNFDSDASDDE